MSKDKLAQVFHFDLYGKREDKYSFLNTNAIDTINWNALQPDEQYAFFVPKDFDTREEYENGFKIDELLSKNNSGVSTDRDSLFLDENKTDLENRMITLLNSDYSKEFKSRYNVNDSSGYPLLKRISNREFNNKYIQFYHYRPFDLRYIYFDDNIISRPAKDVTKNTIDKENILLIAPRQVNENFHHVFLSKLICDSNITSSARLFGSGKLFPLYLYPETNNQLNIGESQNRMPNLNAAIVKKIADGLGLTFVAEKNASTPLSVTNSSSPNVSLSGVEDTLAPIDLLDYVYAVLHSPAYREKYKEFLKIDFPRVPYPTDAATFWQLVKLGAEIRQIHLLESPVVENYITQYPVDGNNVVSQTPKYIPKKRNEETHDLQGDVYINENQYFENVPLVAWGFYIGGYQPAQKWLKDRKGRELSFEDIMHYQKIIVALKKTSELMKEIDMILEI